MEPYVVLYTLMQTHTHLSIHVKKFNLKKMLYSRIPLFHPGASGYQVPVAVLHRG